MENAANAIAIDSDLSFMINYLWVVCKSQKEIRRCLMPQVKSKNGGGMQGFCKRLQKSFYAILFHESGDTSWRYAPQKQPEAVERKSADKDKDETRDP